MHIYFAGDHAGFELKKELMAFVRARGHEVEDVGPFTYTKGDDYPDYVIPLALKVVAQARNYADSTQNDAEMEEVRGIVVAGSGQGEIIAMNRIPGARAALLCPCGEDLIRASRDHNDSNILAIGARFVPPEEIEKGIILWLDTPFSGEERHIRRLRKIDPGYTSGV